MKCPECVAAEQTSKVYPLGSAKTSIGWSPFWDEQGVYHAHDPNRVSSAYKCSNGHCWLEDGVLLPCPNDDCMYGKDVPSCCGGGPQWGHAWECPKCPD